MTGTVERVVDVVADAGPEIRRGLATRRSVEDERNPSGERQLAADVWADELLAERLAAIDGVGAYASEERESILDCGDGVRVALDPLDGSSNLASNNPMGTIFGVYDAPLPASGRDLLAAGYVLYGPTTTMVVAADGVTEYALRPDGRAVLREDVTLPDEPLVYGFGGRRPDWPPAFEAYARAVEDDEYKLRYSGSLLADVNQVLAHGGVFAYPALRSSPEGKLRLQFEANPLAHVIEAVGGRSSDGTRSLLDVDPTALHQRVPVHLGNDALLDRLETQIAAPQ